MPMVTKLTKVVAYHGGPPLIKLYDPLITWSCEITWETKTIKSSLQECPGHQICEDGGPPNLTECGDLPWEAPTRKVTWPFEELPCMHLHDPSRKWCCQVTWQIKCIISPLAEDAKLGKVEALILKVACPLIKWLTCIWLQNLAGWWLTRRAPIYRVTWPFDHVVL